MEMQYLFIIIVYSGCPVTHALCFEESDEVNSDDKQKFSSIWLQVVTTRSTLYQIFANTRLFDKVNILIKVT